MLGNLPHSRPGRRSEKRDAGRPAEAAGAAAEKAEAVDSAAAKTPTPKRAARPRTPAAARTRRTQAPPPAAPTPEPRSRGPVEEAVHLAGRIAGTGVRVAGGVTKEVLRRLPRP